ncbi:MAG: hypothetical protein ACOC38_06695 [Promethearchaeia archaeon]
MEIDSGIGPEPSAPDEPDFSVSWTGMVSRTFALWKRRIAGYLTIMGVTSLAVYALYAAVIILVFGFDALSILPSIGTSPFDAIISLFTLTSVMPTLFVALILMTFVSMVIYAVAGGAAIKLAFDDYGNPGAGDVNSSISYSVNRIWTLIGAQIGVGAIIVVLQIPTLLFSVSFLNGDLSAIASLSILSLVGTLIGVYVGVRLTPVSAVVIAEEDKGTIDAVKRAWSMTSGNFWHILGGQFLLGLVIGIITLVVQMLFTLLAIGVYPSIMTIILPTIFVGILFSSLDYIFQTVIYRDLESRATAEGEDWW